jgi:RNA polymerase sigma-70 factor (ECF subfamily)
VSTQKKSRTVELLFERTNRDVWKFALRVSGNVDTASDLVQDTYLRALRHSIPSDDRAAKAWLYRTLLNRARDLHRRRRVRVADPPAAQAAVAIGEAPDPEVALLSRERIDWLIALLDPRRRAILLLHELDGHSIEWIASTFRIRPSTVRWHLAQAKNELRTALSLERRDPSEVTE